MTDENDFEVRLETVLEQVWCEKESKRDADRTAAEEERQKKLAEQEVITRARPTMFQLRDKRIKRCIRAIQSKIPGGVAIELGDSKIGWVYEFNNSIIEISICYEDETFVLNAFATVDEKNILSECLKLSNDQYDEATAGEWVEDHAIKLAELIAKECNQRPQITTYNRG